MPSSLGPQLQSIGSLLANKFVEYLTEERTQAITLKPQGSYHILDTEEIGYLYGFVVQMDDDDIKLSVTLHGANGSRLPLINHTYQDWVRFGIGLGPGEVIDNPDNTSPDPSGSFNPTYPWLTRYKDTTASDGTGQNKKRFTFIYTPLILLPYTRLELKVFNPTTSTKAVIYARVDRISVDDGNE